MSECRFFHVEAGKGLQRLATREEALAATQAEGYVWIDLFDPSREELEAVAGPLGIHPLAVEDCLDQDQVPKIEDYDRNTFLIFNRYAYADRELLVEEVDLILGRKFLVTVSGHGRGALGAVAKIEEKVRHDSANVEKGPDFLLHVVLDHTVDDKLATIESLEEDIESAEEGMLADAPGFRLEELVRLRRALLSVRKSLFHEREVLVKICRRDSPLITDASIYHFRDIYDHLTKFFEIAEMNRDILTSLIEMYLSLINNRMAEVSNRMNKSVRRLTLITTIFMPLTLVAGIGGMSEWSMMTGPQNWRVAYPLFLLAMVVIGVANYYLLLRLERRSRRVANGRGRAARRSESVRERCARPHVVLGHRRREALAETSWAEETATGNGVAHTRR
jgi:magnesium transporter